MGTVIIDNSIVHAPIGDILLLSWRFKSREDDRYLFSDRARDSDYEYEVSKIKVKSFEPDNPNSKHGTYKLCADVLNEDENDSEECTFYCTKKMIKRLGKCTSSSITVISQEVCEKQLLGTIIDPDTEEFFSSIYKDKSREEIEHLLVLYSILNPEQQKIVCRSLRRELPTIQNGIIDAGLEFSHEVHYRILAELCADLYPPKVLKYIKLLCDKRRKNGLSSSQKNNDIRRLRYITLYPFYMKPKTYDIVSATFEIAETFYGMTDAITDVLESVFPIISDDGKEVRRLSNIICITGKSGLGKFILGTAIARVISDTYTDFPLESVSHESEELSGSPDQYENSEIGLLGLCFSKIGPYGSLITTINDAIEKKILAAYSRIITADEYTDLSVGHPISIKNNVFIIIANDMSEIPAQIKRRAVEINIDKPDSLARLVIGRDYIYKRICNEKTYELKIQIPEQVHEFICNGTSITSSFHEVENKYKKLIPYIRKHPELKTLNVDTAKDILEYNQELTQAVTLTELEQKFSANHDSYDDDRIRVIEDLFEDYRDETNESKKNLILDKLRFNVNYIKKCHDTINIEEIMKKLDEAHYGHKETKAAIKRALKGSVLKGNSNGSGCNILLVGPPGTGKTAIIKKLAELLNREFIRLSLAGEKSESVFRGLKPHISGAEMGVLTKELCRSGKAPLIMGDELDKAPGLFNTLIDILDPNSSDYYEDYIQQYISKEDWIFCATANSLEGMPQALIDRFIIVEISSYSDEDKYQIAKRHVVPELFEEFNLKDRIRISDRLIRYICDEYIQGTSIRTVKKLFSDLFLSAVKTESSETSGIITINKKMIKEYLGGVPIKMSEILSQPTVGAAHCLGVIGSVGSISPVFVIKTPYLERKVTGLPEQMVLETVDNADTIMSTLFDRKLETTRISYGNASIKKDGTSGGVSLTVAMYSCYTEKPVPNEYAFTGEIWPNGNVNPVGGLIEKLNACVSSRVIKRVYIPAENYRVLSEDGDIDRYEGKLTIIPINTVFEVIDDVFGKKGIVKHIIDAKIV